MNVIVLLLLVNVVFREPNEAEADPVMREFKLQDRDLLLRMYRIAGSSKNDKSSVEFGRRVFAMTSNTVCGF